MRRVNLLVALGVTLTMGCGDLLEILENLPDHPAPGGGNSYPPPPEPTCDGFMSADDVQTSIADDLASLDADDAIFTRYVSLANRLNAGLCDLQLDTDRMALVKLLNSTSTAVTLSAPVAIDRGQIIYRIDLRDYNWDRTVEVGGTAFVDGWEAVLDSSPYAVEYTGEDADDAKVDTGTSVPVMYADAFVAAASTGALYYALAGVPSTLDGLLDNLGIDVQQNIVDGEALRGGTTRSRVSRQDRVFERYEVEARAGFFWRAVDFSDESNVSIFDNPLDIAGDGSVVIFSLPNGMLAYAIYDAEGQAREDSDILLDTNQNNFRARVVTSCTNCHASGIIAFEDEVRSFVLDNPEEFSVEVTAKVREIYPLADELERTIDADNALFRQALARVDLPVAAADPIAGSALEFDSDRSAADMAGDLMVSPAEFTRNVALLSPELSVEAVDRDDFSALFLENLCVLSVILENQPIGCGG